MPNVGTTGPHIKAIENAAGDLVFKNTGKVGDYTDPIPTILLPGKAVVRAAAGIDWTDPANDRTDEITATTNLATLKADGTDGDTFFGGGAFTAGQYVVLDDYAVAQYDGAAWQSGVA